MLAKEKWQVNTIAVLEQVFAERCRQVATYGHNEDLVNGTGPDTRWAQPASDMSATELQLILRKDYEEFEDETGNPTWVHLVREEVAEAFQETDPEALGAELLQVAALCVSWVEKLQDQAVNEEDAKKQ